MRARGPNGSVTIMCQIGDAPAPGRGTAFRRVRPRRRRGGAWLACAIGMALHWAGGAVAEAPARALSLEALVAHADCIVHGVVETVSAEPRPEGPGVRTRVRLRVEECYFGAERLAGDTVVLFQGGGALGPLAEIPSVSAAFVPGQERILFLRAAGSGELLVLGVVQGVYDVVRPAADPHAAPRVRRLVGAAEAPVQCETEGRQARAAAGLHAPGGVETLDLFAERLRAAAAARTAGGARGADR